MAIFVTFRRGAAWAAPSLVCDGAEDADGDSSVGVDDAVADGAEPSGSASDADEHAAPGTSTRASTAARRRVMGVTLRQGRPDGSRRLIHTVVRMMSFSSLKVSMR